MLQEVRKGLVSRSDVIYVGGRGHNRVERTRILVTAEINCNSLVRIVVLRGLACISGSRFQSMFIVGNGCGDQDGIDDGALAHRRCPMS